jgi:hypothetical protein
MDLSLPGPFGRQFSWNYDHVAGLWQHNGWIDAAAAAEAKLHYAAYSIRNQLVSMNCVGRNILTKIPAMAFESSQ